MILKRLHIENYGPFAVAASIDIDRQVTVLTGPNDVGKSTILRLIKTICESSKATVDDVNVDRTYDSGVPWQMDNEIKCFATFEVPTNSSQYIIPAYIDNGTIVAGDEIDIEFQLVNGTKREVAIRRGGQPLRVGQYVQQLPAMILFPLTDEIRSEFPISTANSLEQDFLLIALGEEGITKLKSLPSVRRIVEIKQANDRLNNYLKDVLPYELGLELSFAIENINEDDPTMMIIFYDRHGGHTPLHLRGTGIKKVVTLMVALSKLKARSDHILILYDEPENSLHADAQHLLRALLESLASRSNFQVIYATHSPSMINAFNYDGLRLLNRETVNNKATSTIENKPYQENFQPVRASLGLSPSDSLLYARISVIVEGETEVICLPYLLKTLFEKNVEGFQEVARLLSVSHFIDGVGDSFTLWCRMAKSQGSEPIIFVDGDKIRKVKQLQANGKIAGVPVIQLPEWQEFEDIVPKETYFAALAAVVELPTEYTEYQNWEKTAGLPEKMMFSKRVDQWLLEKYEFSLDKVTVMRKALESGDINEIGSIALQQLLSGIKKLVDS